jgi:butyrate kinase
MPAPVLVINPGSTSTKIAIWGMEGALMQKSIQHSAAELAKHPLVTEQMQLRLTAVQNSVTEWLVPGKLSAVVGRGGPLRPLEGGTYKINEHMLEDLRSGKYSNHASNLGAILADYFARKLNIPCYVVDPVTVDEFIPPARISGMPEIQRKCRSHALNIRAVAREVAAKLGKKLEQTTFVVAHMGGGLSICALQGGKIIDVNDGLLGMGPFSPERAGALPIGALVELCFSGTFTKENLLAKLSTGSGLMAYLGTSNCADVERDIEAGDGNAKLYYDAMLYQIAKEIGAIAASLKGKFDAIILTGGMANSAYLLDTLKGYVSFLGKIFVIPGEKEMEALALGAFRVLEGKEQAKTY